MKTKALLILPILLLVSVIVKSQTVTNVSITGSLTVGSEVSANYIIQGSASDTLFFWYEVTLTDTIQVGSGGKKLVIPESSLNRRLLLKVSLEIAGSVVDSAYSALSQLVTSNMAPTASSVTITGSKNVNEYLLGSYSYSDAEGDAESSSIFEWWISSSSTGLPETKISGESDRIFKMRLSDQGKYLIFKVTPVAMTGTPEGAKVKSFAYGPVNSAPYATSVAISGIAAFGNTLTGTYVYNDADGDSQGPGIFKWYRDNLLITDETDSTYLLTADDIGSRIHFEVTPVSLTGFPNTGAPVASAQTAIVTDPSGDKPLAFDVCINGDRTVDSVLRGRYTFTDPKFKEQNSRYFWFRGSGMTTLIGTGITYTMTAEDMESEIFFAVIPRNNKGVEGVQEVSLSLAKINLPAETFSVADPPVVLQADPSGGIFHGQGVTVGTFSPSLAGEGGPYTINYLLDIRLATNTCTQNSSKNVMVKPVVTYFESFRDIYCHDGGHDTIYVRNVPAEATSKAFHVTNPAAVIGYLPGNDTAIIIDPGNMRPGNKLDTLFFTYTLGGSAYPAYRPFVIDSVGKVTIDNLIPGDRFCTNDEPFTLYTNREGGTFSGPVRDVNIFDPSMGLGASAVGYTYVNSASGCSSSVTVPVTIDPSPSVAFTVADFCIEHTNDTTRFLNNTISPDPVTEWMWEFRDGGGVMTSDHESPGYLYLTGGLHQVKLTAITINNCLSSLEKTIDLGVKPEADFYWLNECFHPDDSVHIFDRTLTGSPVTSRTWNFFDGNPPLTSLNPRYPKLSEGFLPVEYIVFTNYAGCGDTARKEIFIRPTIKLGADDYFENFESGPGGWIADQGDINTWSLGTPDRPNISSAASGVNAWYTSYDIASQTPLSSSVTSPCFDFSDTGRPMISLKLWRRFDRNRDGAAIQYKAGDYTDWEYLGTLGDGIEWFNSTLIKGRPGGDQIGWTTLSAPDADWTEARRRLDELNGKRDVKFRIAYGSDGTSQENEGIAFDDIRIGTRTRNVLLEHFTNNSSSSVINANLIVNSVASAMKRDVININYHTNFPGTDLLYNDIPADMSARVLFYGLTRVPWSLIDGGTRNQFAGIYDYLVADLDSTELNKRSLISPQFLIEIDPVISGGLLQVDARITALEELDEENLTLYFAVTAKEIAAVASPNGETVFRNALRKMLPDGGGTKLPKAWSPGQIYDSPGFSWKITNIYDARDIEIIAFIQNNSTRQIYQAEASGINDISVGIESINGGNAAFSLFPNPTTDRLVISFSEPVRVRTMVDIIDLTGKVVRKFDAEPGQSKLEIDNIGLVNGVYVVRLTSGSISGGQRKLIISGIGR
jgi:hypothetical protein